MASSYSKTRLSIFDGDVTLAPAILRTAAAMSTFSAGSAIIGQTPGNEYVQSSVSVVQLNSTVSSISPCSSAACIVTGQQHDVEGRLGRLTLRGVGRHRPLSSSATDELVRVLAAVPVPSPTGAEGSSANPPLQVRVISEPGALVIASISAATGSISMCEGGRASQLAANSAALSTYVTTASELPTRASKESHDHKKAGSGLSKNSNVSDLEFKDELGGKVFSNEQDGAIVPSEFLIASPLLASNSSVKPRHSKIGKRSSMTEASTNNRLHPAVTTRVVLVGNIPLMVKPESDGPILLVSSTLLVLASANFGFKEAKVCLAGSSQSFAWAASNSQPALDSAATAAPTSPSRRPYVSLGEHSVFASEVLRGAATRTAEIEALRTSASVKRRGFDAKTLYRHVLSADASSALAVAEQLEQNKNKTTIASSTSHASLSSVGSLSNLANASQVSLSLGGGPSINSSPRGPPPPPLPLPRVRLNLCVKMLSS